MGLPISFVILNNRRYEALRGFGRLFGMQTVAGTDLSGLDFCGLAAAQGLAARRVDAPGDVDTALAWSFATSAPTLVEMVIE